MKTRFLLVSVTFVGLCFGASFANADDSLKLFDAVDVIPFNTLHTHLTHIYRPLLIYLHIKFLKIKNLWLR